MNVVGSHIPSFQLAVQQLDLSADGVDFAAGVAADGKNADD